ncbi:hypothetical protein B0T20DRAFT_209103 [Sordaria brevicollis]|uniref:Uncharacterized protein n=1 Tax=Sordaria brevicollis TaxID=83679 RepID=A0AAE0PEG0_SORBR|nr:hypothetical protein B0T20DRAFT_209103 [Sordaria brevicollis]
MHARSSSLSADACFSLSFPFLSFPFLSFPFLPLFTFNIFLDLTCRNRHEGSARIIHRIFVTLIVWLTPPIFFAPIAAPLHERFVFLISSII